MIRLKRYLYNLATDKYTGGASGFAKIFLYALSFLYGATVRILAFFCRLRQRRFPGKVISVGNITLGGTGKTTLVEFLAKYLKQQGHRIAIITRGYKRRKREERGVDGLDAMGDEPFMLKLNLKDIPVVVDSRRARAIDFALTKYNADTVILDDGFQQWRIKKDLEIVSIDATQPFGNRHIIPRGILREPLSSLARADIFFLTKTNIASSYGEAEDFLRRVNPAALIVRSIHCPVACYELSRRENLLELKALAGRRVALFSGIGDPASFENLMRSLGVSVGATFRFEDHHRYLVSDLERMIRQSQEERIDTLVTTEKDAARLTEFPVAVKASKIFVLRIELRIVKNEQEFYRRLFGLPRD